MDWNEKQYQNVGFFSAVNLTMGGLDLMKIYIGCHLRTTCFMNHDNGKIDNILMKYSDSMNKNKCISIVFGEKK